MITAHVEKPEAGWMREQLKLTLVQMCSANTHDANIETVTSHIAAAAARGMDFICFPEVAGLFNRDRKSAVQMIVATADDPYLAACRDAARTHRIWVHTGSTPVKSEDDERFLNRSHLLNPDGDVVAEYDKIHLFDVDLPDGRRIRESDRYAPGKRALMPQTPWGPWGMTVCYDLRFPQLYRALAHAGADFISIPAAFTATTGQAHWHVLVRARAIETGCYVFAPDQCGRRPWGRKTYGHSLIVDPWGEVVADAGSERGFIIAEVDPEKVTEARGMIAALTHDRRITAPEIQLRATALPRR